VGLRIIKGLNLHKVTVVKRNKICQLVKRPGGDIWNKTKRPDTKCNIVH
jgi:hypothetical protein